MGAGNAGDERYRVRLNVRISFLSRTGNMLPSIWHAFRGYRGSMGLREVHVAVTVLFSRLALISSVICGAFAAS